MAKASIRKNYIFNTLLTVLNWVFPLVTFPYVSRILGPGGLGKVDFANSILSYFVLIATLGIPLYGVREIARLRDDRTQLNKVFSELFTLNLIMMAISLVLYVALVLSVPKFRLEWLLYLVVGSNIILSLFSIDWLYTGLENYRYITLRSLVVKLLSIAMLFLLLRHEGQYVLYASISVLALSGANFFNIIHSRKYVSISFWKLNIKKHLKGVLVVFALGSTVSIYYNLSKTILGFLSGEYSVGLFSAALKVQQLVVTVIISLGTVAIPRIVYYLEKGEQAEYEALLKRLFRFTFFLGLPIVAGVLVVAEPAIVLFASKKFLASYQNLVWIAPVILIASVSNILGFQVLFPHKEEKKVLYAAILGALMSLILDFVLIPHFKDKGAAAAFLLSELGVLVYQAIAARKYITFSAVNLDTLKYLITAAFMGTLVYFIHGLVHPDWLFLLIGGGIGFLFYFGVLYLLGDSMLKGTINDITLRLLKKSKAE